jgi:hypothetical protein
MTPKFRPNDVVIVKNEQEILDTLDQDGTTDGLSFMPEMRQFCGREFTVKNLVNRIHISGVGVRGIKHTVLLHEARCDGEAHNGCGRACYVLFKDVWLKKSPSAHTEKRNSEPLLPPREIPEFWKCSGTPCQGQASPLLRATFPLSAWDLRQYTDDVRFGTYNLYEVVTLILFRLTRRWGAREGIWRFHTEKKSFRELFEMFMYILRQNIEWLIQRASAQKPGMTKGVAAPQAPAKLKLQNAMTEIQPGDLVVVKSKEEILLTLNAKDKGFGLRFYGCMWKHCGQQYRVLAPVLRLVDEMTEKEVPYISNTFLLEGVVCDGISYRGCPRACYWMWRGGWLKKINEPEEQDRNDPPSILSTD